MKLNFEEITKENFAKYGDLISIDTKDEININNDSCVRYNDLGKIQIDMKEFAGFSIFKAQPRTLPFTLEVFEKHPKASQAFLPCSDNPFYVAVTEGTDQPNLNNIKVFKTKPLQGINFHHNVWHHPLIAINEVSYFWVIDRVESKDNLIEVKLTDKFEIS